MLVKLSINQALKFYSQRTFLRGKNTYLNGKNFINNEFVPSMQGKTFETLNPINECSVGIFADSSTQDIEYAISAAHHSFHSWGTTSGEKRSELLIELSNKISENSNKFSECITSEMGKPISESLIEVNTSIQLLRWYAGECKRINGEVYWSNSLKKQFVLHKPHGVVGLITPVNFNNEQWNFPLNMIVRSLGAALGAGCTLVLKPASDSPLSALLLGDAVRSSGFPPGTFNVVTCNPSSASIIGTSICYDSRVRHISFTGSTDVGKKLKLMTLLSSGLKRCSMELGGNAPFIVFSDACLDLSVKCLMHAKFRNAGQTCISANRIFVHEKIHDAFVDKLVSKVSELKAGIPTDPTTQLSCLYSEKGFKKVNSIVATAVSEGAYCLYQGQNVSYCGPFYFPPTVLIGCKSSMSISKTEIFGPVCAIYKFSSDEILHELKNDSSGLAAYVFSQNINQIIQAIDLLEVGLIAINSSSPSSYLLPFGGHKESGIGSEFGSRALQNYMNTQSVVINAEYS